LNPRPPGYEPGELPDCSTPRRFPSGQVGRWASGQEPIIAPIYLPSYRLTVLPPESGKRDSNPRPQPWQGCALPTELFPRARILAVGPWVGNQNPFPASRLPRFPSFNGGEGDRTPDLVNAIHALSQLSYAPIIFSRPGVNEAPKQHGKLVPVRGSVKHSVA
jgi:hypothetical protein